MAARLPRVIQTTLNNAGRFSFRSALQRYAYSTSSAFFSRTVSSDEVEEARRRIRELEMSICKSKKESEKAKDKEENEEDWFESRNRIMSTKKYKLYTAMYMSSMVFLMMIYLIGKRFYRTASMEEVEESTEENDLAEEEHDSDLDVVSKTEVVPVVEPLPADAIDDFNGGIMESTIHKSQAGFKERKIIEYENRLRQYSTPDKLFRYFATLQDAETNSVYMTPEDFVRSLTPDTLQPIGFGLDEFKKFEKKYSKRYVKDTGLTGSVFLEAFGPGGLISFSDYIFLLTVMGTSPRHISIAFRMFDINGDGDVSLEEFKQVNSIFMNMSTTGSRHRDRKTTGNVVNEMDVDTQLTTYFFGAEGKGKLTVDSFIEFKKRLQREVMKLEFSTYKPVNAKISEAAFAEILLSYAALTPQSKKKTIKRITQEYSKSGDKHQGITFVEYLNFFEFLQHLRDVEMALSFHTVAGQPIDPGTFAQVGRTVAGVELSEHLIDVVFSIFDENGDGLLSNREFISVMKDKVQRGLNKPKDTGLTRFMSAIYECGKQQVLDNLPQ